MVHTPPTQTARARSAFHIEVTKEDLDGACGREDVHREGAIEVPERLSRRYVRHEAATQFLFDRAVPVQKLAPQSRELMEVSNRCQAIDVGGRKQLPIRRQVVEP